MNKKIGMCASIMTFLAVLSFAICMLLGLILKNNIIGNYGSYLSCIFIALGFIPMICSYLAHINNENKAFGFIALSFAIIYAILIMIVYYTQLTTVRLTNLSDEIAGLLDYSKFGLFFNYDLLGYAFMALATFFIGIKLEIETKQEKILKYLLCIHGIFAIGCFLLPTLGVFSANMTGGDIMGIIILEFWCIYFMPVCVLSYKYFKNNKLYT